MKIKIELDKAFKTAKMLTTEETEEWIYNNEIDTDSVTQLILDKESELEQHFSHIFKYSVVCEVKDRFLILDGNPDLILETIRQHINGYGMFYYSSVKEMLKTICQNKKDAILSHFNWLSYHKEIYG